MVRSCHVDTCPVGIATQRPELRAKFAGDAGHDRELPAARCRGGARLPGRDRTPSFGEAVGRSDLLRRAAPAARPRCSTSTPLLAPPAGEVRFDALPTCPSSATGRRAGGDEIAVAPEPAYAIANSDRAVGARLGGAARPGGEAAPALDPFHGDGRPELRRVPPRRRRVRLEGDANDYVGKSLSGGRIVVRPPAGDAGDPCLVGNTVLYGATSASSSAPARAGERFAVRNSGATAVVEGAGSNACEYMTSGIVVDPRRLRPQPRRRA